MTDRQQTMDDTARLKWQFANRVFAFLIIYCAVIGAMLVLNGFNFLGFSLPESVLVLLVCSLIATALGLLIAAARALFGPWPTRN